VTPWMDRGTEHDDTIRPYAIKTTARRLKNPIRFGGGLVTLYRAPEVTEYIDITTGELIPASTLHASRFFPRPIHFGELVLQREAVLKGLREEVRRFAVFVLRFRDQRRGITPGIDQLVNWYAELHGKQTGHVRRYVPQITRAGILAGESLVGPLWQMAGKRTTAKDHVSAPAVASARYSECWRQK
jgi:hypothetical protein